MQIETRNSKKPVLDLFFLSTLIGLVSFIPIIIHHDGQYMDYGDYFSQYIPFLKEMKRMISSRTLAWSWNSFLGDSFVSAYSYYTVFNPFAWILILFPDHALMYGTLAVMLLKFSICSYFSYIFIYLFTKNTEKSKIGALLYTFSGFTIVNTSFYFFLDAIACFPLLLYSLELVLERRKPWLFAIAVFLNAVINYYFFFSSVLITVLYAFFRLELYTLQGWKRNFRSLCIVFAYSIIGLLMAAFAIIPSLYSLSNSGKATSSIGKIYSAYFSLPEILERIKTFLTPVESNRNRAFYNSKAFGSNGVFIPVFGIYGVCAFVKEKTHHYLKHIIIILVIALFVPWFSSAFSLFTSEYYSRWLYGLALMFALVTAMEADDLYLHRRWFKYLFILALLLLIVPLSLLVLQRLKVPIQTQDLLANESKIYSGLKAALIVLAATIFNYFLLYCIIRKSAVSLRGITIIVSIGCVLNYSFYNHINYDSSSSGYSNAYYYEAVCTPFSDKDPQFHRIDHPRQIFNYGLFIGKPSVNYYNSLQSNNSTRFAVKAGMFSDEAAVFVSTPKEIAPIVDTLLSVKYYYDYDGSSEIPEGFEYFYSEGNVAVYRNRNFIPMGYTYDCYTIENQLINASPLERSVIMLNALVVNSEDAPVFAQLMNHCELSNTIQDISQLAEQRQKQSCDNFSVTGDGFSAEIMLKNDNFVFFSVPNDPGWKIYINGCEAEVYTVNYGLMAVKCFAGNNQIVAEFHPLGVTLGAYISIAAWCIFGVLLWYKNTTGNKLKSINAINKQ